MARHQLGHVQLSDVTLRAAGGTGPGTCHRYGVMQMAEQASSQRCPARCQMRCRRSERVPSRGPSRAHRVQTRPSRSSLASAAPCGHQGQTRPQSPAVPQPAPGCRLRHRGRRQREHAWLALAPMPAPASWRGPMQSALCHLQHSMCPRSLESEPASGSKRKGLTHRAAAAAVAGACVVQQPHASRERPTNVAAFHWGGVWL